MSGKTFEQAREVVRAADEREKFKPLLEEMNRTGRVNGVYRKLKVELAAEEIERELPPLPTGPFRVIVADPPWHYEKSFADPSCRGTAPPYAPASWRTNIVK